MQQEYLVLTKIGGAGDPEMWLPGSKIRLDDARAAAHLAAGNIAPLDKTVLPAAPALVEVEIVHTPEEASESWQP